MDRRLGWEIERIILAIIIILSILNFASLVGPFWGYVLDIIAWTTIAYIIYVVSPTELFFGERHAGSDLTIVVAYVIMSAKDLIGQAMSQLPILVQSAPSYVKFVPTQVTNAVPFAITAEEMNAYHIFGAIPSHIVQAVVTNFNFAHQQLNISLVSAGEQIGLLAYPTTLDGSLLTFYNTIVQHAFIIEKVSLVAGMLLLLIVAMYASYKISVRKPSILAVVHEEGPATLWRAFWVFLLLAGFFVVVFNLLFEWMTITNDTPLLLALIVVVGLILFVKHAHLRFDEIIDRIGDTGEAFYKRVLHLFMDSKTILLGISGFLVLHLLTDVGNFIAPAIFFWYKTLYVQSLPGDHTALLTMISSSLTGNVLQDILIILAYIASTLGIIFLLVLPAVIWYKIFKIRESHEHLPDWKGWHVGLVLSCIVVYILLPVFKFTTIGGGELVGVNLTSSALDAGRLGNLHMVLGIAAGVFLVCTIIGGMHDYGRRVLMLGPFLAAAIFFGIYVYYYFISAFVYYASLLVRLLQEGMFSVIIPVLIIFAFTILFFVTGFFSFLYEIWRD
jgi:hypothetical protein